MKYPHYLDYSPEATQRCESALLSVLATLSDFRDDLVLVGGLAPRYLCKPAGAGPHPVTMDVDLGIALGASSGQYESVAIRLANNGFVPEQAAPGHPRNRLVKKMPDKSSLILDLLTEKPNPDAPDSVQVEGLWMDAYPGITRALRLFREVPVRGTDLLGATVEEFIKVSEIGPFLCLKLSGYAGRAESKDVFDIVYSVKNYDRGPDEAARLFREEADCNPAYESALRILERRFLEEGAKGPTQYADFLTSGQRGPEVREERARLANETVDVAIRLLGRP